jgi:hypothetical protein
MQISHHFYKAFYTTAVVFLLCGFCSAQTKQVFLELGGSGGLGSINLEKPLFINLPWVPRDNCGPLKPVLYSFTWRLGLGASPIDQNNGWVLIFPAMVNMVYGVYAHRIEFGTGIAPSVTTKGSLFIKSPVMLGYRFQPPDKKLFFRVTYTPLVSWLVDFQWQHWAGISIGYNFTE